MGTVGDTNSYLNTAIDMLDQPIFDETRRILIDGTDMTEIGEAITEPTGQLMAMNEVLPRAWIGVVGMTSISLGALSNVNQAIGAGEADPTLQDVLTHLEEMRDAAHELGQMDTQMEDAHKQALGALILCGQSLAQFMQLRTKAAELIDSSKTNRDGALEKLREIVL